MFNFFKKKQNEVEIPQVQPMAAWEENSYMHVLSNLVDDDQAILHWNIRVKSMV